MPALAQTSAPETTGRLRIELRINGDWTTLIDVPAPAVSSATVLEQLIAYAITHPARAYLDGALVGEQLPRGRAVPAAGAPSVVIATRDQADAAIRAMCLALRPFADVGDNFAAESHDRTRVSVYFLAHQLRAARDALAGAARIFGDLCAPELASWERVR